MNNKILAIQSLLIKKNSYSVQSVKLNLLIKDFRINPASLVSWLFRVHKQNDLTPQLEFKAYLRGAKKVIDKFGKKKTKYLLRELEGEVVFEYPFTFKFVYGWCERNDFEIKETKTETLSLI